MARPPKIGLDYFPLDCVIDKKFKLVEAKYGLLGFAVIIKLYQAIYADHGYYYEWDNSTALLLAAEYSSISFPVTPDEVNGIVNEAVNRSIFDRKMFTENHILTSRGIQKRYFEAIKRRTKFEVEKRYLLISIPENLVSDDNNAVSAYNNPAESEFMYAESTQSKVKNSKVNKKKIDSNKLLSIKEKEKNAFIDLILNDGSCYTVNESEVVQYERYYPHLNVRQELRNMAVWCNNNPTKRKTRRGIGRFIANWLTRSSERKERNNGKSEGVANQEGDSDPRIGFKNPNEF